MMRRARRDDNEAVVVDALRACGAVVRRLNVEDLPDLLVLHGGRVHLLEVKSEKGKLRRGQRLFVLIARSAGVEVHVVRNPEEAIAAMRAPLLVRENMR